jgi:hypothetical protein
LAAEKKAAHRKKDLKLYFKEFNNIIVKYKINLADIYNINKTGFRIRVITGRTVIIHLLTKAVYFTDLNN